MEIIVCTNIKSFLPNTNTTPWDVPMQMREDTAYKK